MTAVLKSLAAAVLGAALFFCFFMMFSIPVLTLIARQHNPNDVTITPVGVFRAVGLPLSAAAFAACFVLAMKKFRKSGDRPSAVEHR